jgi:glutaredoxin
MPNLTLYHFAGCPYCQRVRDYLKAANVTIPTKDIHQNPAWRDELIKIGGKPQVPCLVIDGKALYESAEIIKWFKNNSFGSV